MMAMLRAIGWGRRIGGRALVAGAGFFALGCGAATPGQQPEAAAPAAETDGGVLVLRGRVIDGTGAAPLEGAVVVVEGERIRCVGTRCSVPRGARVIDAGAGTILPGLIDLHTHARPHFLGLFLPAGVTSIRDLNNTFAMIDTLHQVEPHRPRIFWSGPLVDGEKSVIGALALRVRTPDEARAAIDTLYRRGARVVKLYEHLPPDAYAAGAARAQELGLPVATDLGIQLTRGLRGAEVDALQALQAGITSIEHASGFALAYQRLGGDPTRPPLDPALVDTLARALVRSGAALVPTLVASHGFASETLPSIEGLPMADRLPEGFVQWWTGLHASLKPEQRQRAANDTLLARALTRRVHELGGRIGAGSDTPAGPMDLPGGGLHRELELLVEAGLTPLAALRAATGEAARILGSKELGVVAPGAIADLIVVEGDPATDIRATRGVRLVVQGGKVLPMEALLARVAGGQ